MAYVDEGNDSFDVSISLDTDKKLIEYSCDCDKERICVHVQTLYNQVTVVQPKKLQPPVPKTKSLKTVLDNADPDVLKEWVWQLVSANEEVKLLFTNEFKPPTHYDPANVRELLTNAKKAVIGNEAFPQNKQVVRFVKSLSMILRRIVRFYLEAPFEKEHYDTIKTVLEYLDENNVRIDSEKLLDSITDSLTPIVEALRQINDEELFKKSVGFFLQDLHIDKPSGTCAVRLLSLLSKTVDADRARYLIEQFASIFTGFTGAVNDFSNESAKLYKNMLVFHHVFDVYGYTIPMGLADQETNNEIVQQLIASRKLEAAALRSWKIYRNSWLDQHQIAALRLLKTINISRGDDADLARVLELLVLRTYDYEDFVLLQRQLSHDKAASLRKRMMDTACAQLHINPSKFPFVFKVFESEKNYEKMLRFLNRTGSYRVIEPSIEVLIEFNSDLFLKKMFEIRDHLGPDSNYNVDGEEFECVNRLVSVTLKHYSEEDLRSTLEKFFSNKTNYFGFNYFTARLAEAVQVS